MTTVLSLGVSEFGRKFEPGKDIKLTKSERGLILGVTKLLSHRSNPGIREAIVTSNQRVLIEYDPVVISAMDAWTLASDLLRDSQSHKSPHADRTLLFYDFIQNGPVGRTSSVFFFCDRESDGNPGLSIPKGEFRSIANQLRNELRNWIDITYSWVSPRWIYLEHAVVTPKALHLQRVRDALSLSEALVTVNHRPVSLGVVEQTDSWIPEQTAPEPTSWIARLRVDVPESKSTPAPVRPCVEYEELEVDFGISVIRVPVSTIPGKDRDIAKFLKRTKPLNKRLSDFEGIVFVRFWSDGFGCTIRYRKVMDSEENQLNVLSLKEHVDDILKEVAKDESKYFPYGPPNPFEGLFYGPSAVPSKQ